MTNKGNDVFQHPANEHLPKNRFSHTVNVDHGAKVYHRAWQSHRRREAPLFLQRRRQDLIGLLTLAQAQRIEQCPTGRVLAIGRLHDHLIDRGLHAQRLAEHLVRRRPALAAGHEEHPALRPGLGRTLI